MSDAPDLSPHDDVLAGQLRSYLLSRMSHELRTPLNVILGFAQLLQDAGLRGEDAHNLSMIIQSGQHLMGLVEDVMDVADIGAGRYPVNQGRVTAADAIAESADLVRHTAAASAVTVRVDPGPDIDVVADRRRLVQALVHVVTNAVQYNHPGGQVTIDWAVLPQDRPVAGHVPRPRAAEQDGGVPAVPGGAAPALPGAGDGAGWLRVRVTDTGHGIPAEVIHRVFLPFDRLGVGPDSPRGTGIGLALSRALVETMGGRIGVRSTPGVGSTFHLDLRLLDPAGVSGDEPTPADPLTDRPAGAGAVVLYIEDNAENLTLMRRIFARRPGLSLRSAADPATGLAMIRRQRPDLVLLDLHLPDRADGERVLRAVRADTDPTVRATPVVMVTADLTSGTERALLGFGASGFVGKPVDVPALLATIDRHLAHGVDADTPD